MDLARLPLRQKEITAKCQQAGKPVIVATEMLHSVDRALGERGFAAVGGQLLPA